MRKALGRTQPIAAPTAPPPEILEPVARLVHSDIGLPELFAKRAADNKMHVDAIASDDVADHVAGLLKEKGVRRVAVPVSPLLESLGVVEALRAAGLEVRTWDQITLDELYDFDAAVTDVTYAIAETGSLVIKTGPQHGRALSLVPLLHVAIVEPRNCLPDLLDLMDALGREGIGNNVTIITGPSKTADIEGALVVGVHGPGEVQVFVLQ
ncbi:MAG TPA: LUD domain-containing protein [Tepidisphaeraceae bacterium]